MKYWRIFVMMVFFLVPAIAASAASDIDQHRDCRHCGMDRKQFGYSRMMITYSDGTSMGTCSLHCIITDMNINKDKKVALIQVADRDSQKLIDAAKAFWVVGGSKRGVMTARAKWAFETKASAEKFVAKYGGKLASWDEALQAARDDAAPKTHKH